MVHNKKSEYELVLASQINNIDCSVIEGGAKDEDENTISKRQEQEYDEEIGLCLEEIERNLAKLRQVWTYNAVTC